LQGFALFGLRWWPAQGWAGQANAVFFAKLDAGSGAIDFVGMD
jgi:hypothetical protein